MNERFVLSVNNYFNGIFHIIHSERYLNAARIIQFDRVRSSFSWHVVILNFPFYFMYVRVYSYADVILLYTDTHDHQIEI